MCGFVFIIRMVSLVLISLSALECDGRMRNRTLAVKINIRDDTDLIFF